VADNGVGIAAEALDKVFDPFFTTRDVGQGMGMGLAFCHATVTSWGGTMKAASEPGRGASIIMTLKTSRP
jgi:two-component system C4-dicarboxylate transport sensor histidine kinase DctB